LKAEILDTDTLLKAVDPQRSTVPLPLRRAQQARACRCWPNAHLKSVMWNIDSLDWADPVPSSIADRVLRAVDKEQRGIILFHDIHERTVKALPMILERWPPRATSSPAGTAAASRRPWRRGAGAGARAAAAPAMRIPGRSWSASTTTRSGRSCSTRCATPKAWASCWCRSSASRPSA
jgi:hypothetical protein